MKEKAVGYVRVSTSMQAEEGVSLDAQEEKIRAYCQMSGLELVALIREEGISGSIPLDERTGGKMALSALKANKAKHIIALKLDRLFRNAEDALRQTRRWDKEGIALHLVDIGGQTLNTSTAMGKMFLTMTAAFAELERNLIAERTIAAMNHKKTRKNVYSPTPLGYERVGDKLVANDTELALIARIKQLRQDGITLGQIAATLNLEGIQGKNGGRWHASTVKKVLDNSLHQGVA